MVDLRLALLLSTWSAPDAPSAPAGAEPARQVEVVGSRRVLVPGRASSRVERADLEERLPRSAPDALWYEPGVYIQMSAHGQGSPYVRGRTGQQILAMFDGIRLNTSTWRQGPNQYFFTVDAAAVQAIEVTRGGASTLFGSDAIAGVIEARPLEPTLDPERRGFHPAARATLRGASSDGELGGRAQLDAQLGPRLALLTGIGHRRVGQLRSGGPIHSPETGLAPMVPAFADDGLTQLGTGFGEITADARLVFDPTPSSRITAAGYLYRQYDSPRTDQCPAPFAPRDECLNYDEQFRSLAYLAHQGSSTRWLRRHRLAISYQRQHERRTLRRPSSFVRNGGRDDVDTWGFTFKSETGSTFVGPAAVLLRAGVDAYRDRVDSVAWSEFTDVRTVIGLARGQYTQGARYLQGGLFLQPEARLGERWVLRAGARLAGAAAHAAAEPTSGTSPVDSRWLALVGNAGLEWRVFGPLALLATYDRSFRAPNLDDLTSRQQTGPGFQFENAGLRPETAHTFELGVRLQRPSLLLDGWLFRSVVTDAVTRSLREIADCPPATPACATSWSRFQLVNARDASLVHGAELQARLQPTRRAHVRLSLAYARGSGPNPQEPPADPTLAYVKRVPLSRVPPLNGTFEGRWAFGPYRWSRFPGLGPAAVRPDVRPYLGASLRWARAQTRLHPTDRSDARIPQGGTPGFAVLDVRAGVRLGERLLLALVLENFTNAPYRTHGSSVNGAGRGLMAHLEAGL